MRTLLVSLALALAVLFAPTNAPACPPVWDPNASCFGTGIDPQTDPCVALDWDGDCDVDGDDIAAMVVDYFNGEPCTDFTCDGIHDSDDLGDLLTAFDIWYEACSLWPPC